MQGAVAAPPGGFTPAGDTKAYVLHAGKPVHTQIIEWANSSGWVLKWSPDTTWEVFAETTIHAATTDQAVEQVVQNLRMEGKPIRLRVYTGNRVMEVEALIVGESK
ncbi:MAG TPA: TcpQ domain-containing protein [Xanthomonadales bacterium]|nr:TcpQ domain-containing protein [Xanthomonadales bacterium]